uniref:sphingolipid C(9)-methyltransferase n=1 Tax=Bionectria ochroleuca TaxID=29856 RepID=A0A8H7K6E0_BIOOC
MAEKNVPKGTQFISDIKYISTPPAAPAAFATGQDCGVPLTNSAAIPNPKLPADGSGRAHFSNATLASLLLGIPTAITILIGGGALTGLLIGLLTLFPILISFWTWVSRSSPRINEKAKLPGRPVEYYISFKNASDQAKWKGDNKIPMSLFARKYLDGSASFNGDVLEILEYRHDWADFRFTWYTFKFLLCNFFPDVFFHTRAQDLDQIRPTYDKGNDHYAFFLGPRMVYTSGLISDTTREETLEEMQDNKMAVVCEKIGLKEGEKLLDIGCGWGTLAKFASVNYGAKATGLTIAEHQAAWGNDVLRKAGVPSSQSNILCLDYRDIPKDTKYDKITQLEMGEHVGVKKLTSFFRQCGDLLNDDGVMYVQLSGLRQEWQYEDFIWGLYLNEHIFPGADASTPLWNYVRSLEMGGFEVKSIDTVGVHYSATIWRWYRNWVGNKETIRAKFGETWYRTWELFLAWSSIASRQGSATCFQFVAVKNLNSTHRINGVPTQYGLHGALAASKEKAKSKLQ